MTELRDDLDQALRSVPISEAPVQRAMRDGRRLRGKRRLTVLAGALAIAAAAAGAPSLARDTAAAPPVPLTGPTATPAATQTRPGGDPVITDLPAPGATREVGGLTSRNGVIAAGTVGAARWQLTVRGPGKANPEPADSCATVTFSTATPSANLGNGSCLDLQAVLGSMVSGGDPAALAGAGDGTTEVTFGEAADDVTFFIVTFTDGQHLKLIPVTSGGHRYVGWVAPQHMVVAGIRADLGGPYADSGQTATAVPYDPPGAVPSFGLWQRAGQAAPPRAHAVIGQGTADGTAWSTSAYEGPWGTCVVVSPNDTSCWRTRLATTTVLGGGAGGSTPESAYGSVAPGVARLRVTLSNGTTVQVTPVTVGDERLFACWTGAGVSPTGWTAYDAAGRVTGSHSMASSAATSG